MKAAPRLKISGTNYSPVLEPFHQTTFPHHFHLIIFHTQESIGPSQTQLFICYKYSLGILISANSPSTTLTVLTSCHSLQLSPPSCLFLTHFAKCDFFLPKSLGLCIFLKTLLTLCSTLGILFYLSYLHILVSSLRAGSVRTYFCILLKACHTHSGNN